MTTRVFRARSLIDARQAAVAALGRDAVVLSTREVRRPGLLGLLGATEVEVAAVSVPKPEPAPSPPVALFAAGAYRDERRALAPKDDVSRAAVVNALRADLRSEIRAVKTALGKSLTGPGAQTADLVAEVAAMREALEQLAPTAPRNGRVASLLRARGIEGRTAMAITRALKNAPDEGLPERMRSFLAATITVTPWPLPARGDRVLVAAVGQSGVGKTTTLAKLATLARAAGSTVTLVSCDTLRVGGTEHLRRYATLLDVAFEVARSPEELEEVIQGARTDIVFVDTSGRAPRAGSAEMALAEERFAEREACGTLQRHVLLCTPAASREIDVVSSMKSFATTAPTAIALTKLDETALPSGIIHAAMVTKLPVASVCAGPRVPEDIEAADVQRLVELVMHASESRRARAA